MKRVGAVTIALLAAIVLAPACAAPTEMTVHVMTNIACSVVGERGVSVAVGEVSSIRDRIPALKTQRCVAANDGSGLNEVGHVVIVPSGDKEAEIAIRVVAGIDVPESDCMPETAYKGCIVERVLLPFVAHENLHVEIRLAASCKDVPCDEVTTCANGSCVSARIDPSTCIGSSGCSNDGIGDGGNSTTLPDGAPNDSAGAKDAGDDGTTGGDADACGSGQPLLCPPSLVCPGGVCYHGGMTGNWACYAVPEAPDFATSCFGDENCPSSAPYCCGAATSGACSATECTSGHICSARCMRCPSSVPHCSNSTHGVLTCIP